jgi:hypothetical protein
VPRCVVIELKSSAPRAYVFPDAESARAWYDRYQERWSEGGNVILTTPTADGLFTTVYGAERITSLRLECHEQVVEIGLSQFEATFARSDSTSPPTRRSR